MTAAVKKIDEIMTNIAVLSKQGKYGAAICYINNVFLSSDEDLKRVIRDAIREEKNRSDGVDACGECCGSCLTSECGSLYCLGFMITFFCCGRDAASTCCGCDFMIDSSSTCCREQCF